MNAQEQFFLIPLNQIPKWETGTPCKNGILAEVPILQRGLVWDQSQIELLWDSILRGIPIGSIVLCRITKSSQLCAFKWLIQGLVRWLGLSFFLFVFYLFF